MLISVALGAAVTAPVVYWLISGNHDLVALYRSSIAPMAATFKATAIGPPQGRLCSARLLVPTRRDRAAVSGSGGARMERDQGRSRMRSLDRSEADWRLLLLHLTLGGFVVLLIGALATGATHYLERYMHPFFLLTPLWPAWARWTRGQRVTTARHPRHPTGRHYRPRGAAHCTPWARNATNAASLFHMRAWLRRWLRAASSRARSSPRAATMPVICAALPEARIVRLERPPYAPPPRAVDLSSRVAVVWRKGPEGSPAEGRRRRVHADRRYRHACSRTSERPLAAVSGNLGRASL